MSVVSNALQGLENHLPKVIDSQTHGVIDYSHAALFLGASAFFWKRDRKAAIAALATGSFILVQSLLTDYPLGAKPVFSFKTHGEMDSAFVPAALSLPRLLGFGKNGAAWFFRANAIAEAFVVGMTDFDSEHARAEKRENGSYGDRFSEYSRDAA